MDALLVTAALGALACIALYWTIRKAVSAGIRDAVEQQEQARSRV